jgi:hypothetical protein
MMNSTPLSESMRKSANGRALLDVDERFEHPSLGPILDRAHLGRPVATSVRFRVWQNSPRELLPS